MLDRVSAFSERLGAWAGKDGAALAPTSRRENRIRTIQASLEIEQNTLTIEQVRAVIEGKTVLGPPREIQEVKMLFGRTKNWSNGRRVKNRIYSMHMDS